MVDSLSLGSLAEKLSALAGPDLIMGANMFCRLDNDGISLAERTCKLFGIRIKTPIPRKLTAFPDNEGKTRIIGILDYWSQSALKPIHDALNGILKRIREDCTFDQESFTRGIPKDCKEFYSFDLKNATDRIPLVIQARLISYIFGEEVGKL